MTREDLSNIIYNSGYCPKHKCLPETFNECKGCYNRELTEYENKIYNQAFDDAIETVKTYFKCAIDNEYKYMIHDDIDRQVELLLMTNKSICNCLENKRELKRMVIK